MQQRQEEESKRLSKCRMRAIELKHSASLLKMLYAKRRKIGRRLNSMLQIQKDLRRHHFKSRKKKKKIQPYKDHAVSNNSSRYNSNRQQIRPRSPKMPSMQYLVMHSWSMYHMQSPQNYKNPNSYFHHRWTLKSKAMAWCIQSQMKLSQNTKK